MAASLDGHDFPAVPVNPRAHPAQHLRQVVYFRPLKRAVNYGLAIMNAAQDHDHLREHRYIPGSNTGEIELPEQPMLPLSLHRHGHAPIVQRKIVAERFKKALKIRRESLRVYLAAARQADAGSSEPGGQRGQQKVRAVEPAGEIMRHAPVHHGCAVQGKAVVTVLIDAYIERLGNVQKRLHITNPRNVLNGYGGGGCQSRMQQQQGGVLRAGNGNIAAKRTATRDHQGFTFTAPRCHIGS